VRGWTQWRGKENKTKLVMGNMKGEVFAKKCGENSREKWGVGKYEKGRLGGAETPCGKTFECG